MVDETDYHCSHKHNQAAFVIEEPEVRNLPFYFFAHGPRFLIILLIVKFLVETLWEHKYGYKTT